MIAGVRIFICLEGLRRILSCTCSRTIGGPESWPLAVCRLYLQTGSILPPLNCTQRACGPFPAFNLGHFSFFLVRKHLLYLWSKGLRNSEKIFWICLFLCEVSEVSHFSKFLSDKVYLKIHQSKVIG